MLLEENEESYVYRSRRKNIALKKTPKSDSYYHSRVGDGARRRNLLASSQSDRKP